MLRVLAVACCAAALAPRAAPQRRHSVKLAASAEDAPSAEPVAAATAAAAAQLSAAQSAAEAAETVAAAAVVETVAAAVVETVAAAAVETAAPVPAAPKKTDYESLKSAHRRGCETYAAAEAVALGLCDEKDFVGAAKLFEHSLTLPGDGRDVVRVQNKASPVGGGPVLRGQEEVRFASPLQKQTAWFNVACCKAKVGDGDGACEALETALKLGFDDYQLIRSDSDFDDCRSDVDALLKTYEPKAFLSGFFKAPSFVDWK